MTEVRRSGTPAGSGSGRPSGAPAPTAAHRRKARIVGGVVVAILAAGTVTASLSRSDVDSELRRAEAAMAGFLRHQAGAEKEMRRRLARARRRGLTDFRPAWLSALAWHLNHVTHRCDPKVGGPLRRGACLLRKGRAGAAAALYADRLPEPSGRYLAAVARRLAKGRGAGGSLTPRTETGGPNR